MRTDRKKFRVSDTYQEIQWTTPIGSVEFKICPAMSWVYRICVYAVINGKEDPRYIDFDCEEGRKRLIKKINAKINAWMLTDE